MEVCAAHPYPALIREPFGPKTARDIADAGDEIKPPRAVTVTRTTDAKANKKKPKKNKKRSAEAGGRRQAPRQNAANEPRIPRARVTTESTARTRAPVAAVTPPPPPPAPAASAPAPGRALTASADEGGVDPSRGIAVATGTEDGGDHEEEDIRLQPEWRSARRKHDRGDPSARHPRRAASEGDGGGRRRDHSHHQHRHRPRADQHGDAVAHRARRLESLLVRCDGLSGHDDDARRPRQPSRPTDEDVAAVLARYSSGGDGDNLLRGLSVEADATRAAYDGLADAVAAIPGTGSGRRARRRVSLSDAADVAAVSGDGGGEGGRGGGGGEGYGKHCRARDAGSGPCSSGVRAAINFLKALLYGRYVPPHKCVMDLGCCRGQDMYKLQYCKPERVLLVDISARCLYAAERRWCRNGYPFPASFLQADFCSPSFLRGRRVVIYAENPARKRGEQRTPTLHDAHPTGEAGADLVNAVVCNNAAHHAFRSRETAETFVANVVRVLRPGGVFFGTAPDGDRLSALLASRAGVSAAQSPDATGSVGGGGGFARLFSVRPEPPSVGDGIGDSPASQRGNSYVPYWFSMEGALECRQYTMTPSDLRDLCTAHGLMHLPMSSENMLDLFKLESKNPRNQSLMERTGVPPAGLDAEGEAYLALHFAFVFVKPNPSHLVRSATA